MAPTDSDPSATRLAPSHSTATLDAFRTSPTVGNISAISRPARSAVSVSSALTSPKRRASWRSRTKARTTRMPVICSRSTWLMPSMRSCMTRNWGTMRDTIRPTLITRAGMLMRRSSERPASSRIAITVPPMAVMGAATSSVQDSSTSICTCCTSFVMRVIRVGAPKVPTSWAE